MQERKTLREIDAEIEALRKQREVAVLAELGRLRREAADALQQLYDADPQRGLPKRIKDAVTDTKGMINIRRAFKSPKSDR